MLSYWCEAGYEPDSFWRQSPSTFEACLQGAQKRMEHEIETGLSNSWHSAAFVSAAQAGKLKPFKHYLRKPSRKMGSTEMLANMRLLAARVNRKFGET